jgi:hypothetical protein
MKSSVSPHPQSLTGSELGSFVLCSKRRKTVMNVGSKSIKPVARSRSNRITKISILILGGFLLGCVSDLHRASAKTPAIPELSFEQSEFIIGSAKRQSVLTGFLLDGPSADVLVVSIDENGERHLRIYAYGEQTWMLKFSTTLPPQTQFVDVANIGGRDRLLTYEPGHLNRFDPASGTTQELVTVTTNFTPPRDRGIPHVDITRDVNKNGRVDLVIPDVDGFWVFIQSTDGAFADGVKIGPPTDMRRIYGADGYRYNPWRQSRIYEIDFDHDGRIDLAHWNQDHFDVHLQDKRGLFVQEARTYTTDVAFDSDDISHLAAGDMQGKVLHSVTDLNNDGIADLVVLSLEGTSVSRKRSAYEVHFGAPSHDGGTEFSRDVGTTIQSEGRIQLGMDRRDFDGDGKADLMLTTIDVKFLKRSLWKQMKGYMGDGIWLNLEFYRWKDGLYPDQPNAIHKIGLLGAPTFRSPGWVPLDIVLRGGTHESRESQSAWSRAFNTNVLIGDVTGNDRSDLLIEETFRGLDAFAGVPGPGLFGVHPQQVSVILPNDEEYVWLADLNKDGKQDIIMHHPYTLRDIHGAPIRPPGTEPHRVRILIAR